MKSCRVYADHAATTPLCDAAWSAMVPFLRDEFGNPSNLHSWAKKPREAVRAARETIAKCIGAESADEIFFTSGGTESDNWVIKGTDGDLMVSAYEHHAVLNTAASESARGRNVVSARPGKNGCVVKDNIASSWRTGIKLVSVMAANNEIGTTNNLKELSEYGHDQGALFHTDAVQALGHIPINVRRDGIDFLSGSAHKFNGPRGVGFLYKRNGVKLKSLHNGGQQESGCRAGTENVSGIVGMAAALQWNCDNMEAHTRHLNKLKGQLLDGIGKHISDAIYPGASFKDQLPGFISVCLPRHPAEGVLHILDLKGIAISAGAACDTKNTQMSHVLKAINLPNELIECTVRISLGVENSEDDVAHIASALKLVVR